MRRPQALAGMGSAALLALAAVAAGGDASSGEDRHYFEIRIVGSGTATADYGEERRSAKTDTSGVDGKESLAWRWEVRAAALSVASGPLTTRTAGGRSRDVLETSLISWHRGRGPVEEDPLCGELAGRTITVSNDGRGLKAWRRGRGELVDEGRVALREGDLLVSAPVTPRSCFHGWDEGDLKYVYSVRRDEAVIPRGEFNPRFEPEYERTFGPFSVNLDRSHSSELPSQHTFVAESSLEVEIERISERRFDRLVRKLQHLPAGSGELEYHEPG